MAARALLFINPRSRLGHERKPQAVAALARLGIDIIDVSSTPLNKLPAIARKNRRLIDRIIVGGGDGTINRLLEPLLKIRQPVGILPLGTANDLVTTLGIPLKLEDACAVIAAGKQRHIDLGSVNGKHFVNVASLGISQRIARDLDPAAKKRWGIFAIAARASRVLTRPRRFRARIRCDGTRYDVQTFEITVGNGKHFGGFITSLDADISDHLLELYSLELEKLADIAKLLPALANGRFAETTAVRFQRGREIRVTTEHPRNIYTDGERTARTPAVFRVVPSALAVFAPPKKAAR